MTSSQESDEEFLQARHIVQDPDVDKEGKLMTTEIFRPTQFRAARNRLSQATNDIKAKYRELHIYYILKAKEFATIKHDLEEHRTKLENGGRADIVPNEVSVLTEIIKQKYRFAKKNYNAFKKTEEGKESLKKELILTQMKMISKDAAESQILVDIMCTQLRIDSTWDSAPSEVRTVRHVPETITVVGGIREEHDRPPDLMLFLSVSGSTESSRARGEMYERRIQELKDKTLFFKAKSTTCQEWAEDRTKHAMIGLIRSSNNDLNPYQIGPLRHSKPLRSHRGHRYKLRKNWQA